MIVRGEWKQWKRWKRKAYYIIMVSGRSIARVFSIALILTAIFGLFFFYPRSKSLVPLTDKDEATQWMNDSGGVITVDRSLTWKDVFPNTGIDFYLRPSDFYQAFNHLTSIDLTLALNGTQLRGKDLAMQLADVAQGEKPWMQFKPNATLAEIMELENFDDGSLWMLKMGFKGSKLFESASKAACAILREDGTHIIAIGDSTIGRLFTYGIFPQCGENILSHSITQKDNNWGIYDCYGAKEAQIFSKLPKGTRRVLLVMNFSGQHALNLHPLRPMEVFNLLKDSPLKYRYFEDYIQHLLAAAEEGAKENAGVEYFVITVNTNAVAHERYIGDYQQVVEEWEANSDKWAEKCEAENTYTLTAEECNNSILALRGSKLISEREDAFLSKVLPHRFSLPRRSVDVFNMTIGKGHFSQKGDGRHFNPLIPLKISQIITLYVLMRIEAYYKESFKQ